MKGQDDTIIFFISCQCCRLSSVAEAIRARYFYSFSLSLLVYMRMPLVMCAQVILIYATYTDLK